MRGRKEKALPNITTNIEYWWSEKQSPEMVIMIIPEFPQAVLTAQHPNKQSVLYSIASPCKAGWKGVNQLSLPYTLS